MIYLHRRCYSLIRFNSSVKILSRKFCFSSVKTAFVDPLKRINVIVFYNRTAINSVKDSDFNWGLVKDLIERNGRGTPFIQVRIFFLFYFFQLWTWNLYFSLFFITLIDFKLQILVFWSLSSFFYLRSLLAVCFGVTKMTYLAPSWLFQKNVTTSKPHFITSWSTILRSIIFTFNQNQVPDVHMIIKFVKLYLQISDTFFSFFPVSDLSVTLLDFHEFLSYKAVICTSPPKYAFNLIMLLNCHEKHSVKPRILYLSKMPMLDLPCSLAAVLLLFYFF